MATVKIEAALGELGDIGDIVGTVKVKQATDSFVTAKDRQGDGFTLTGTNLSYDASGVAGGNFTSLRIFNAAGDTLESVSGFSVNAKNLYMLYTFAGLSAAVFDLFKNDDKMTGSSVADKIFGFAGNDVIKGGGGNDIIGGSIGNDKLYGQAGADTFIYVAGDGKDTILDFTDTNAPSDDQIGLTQQLYNAMTTEQTATGVTLHFGAKGAINVVGWHLADLDVTDFILV